MNGHEHYLEAELLLEEAAQVGPQRAGVCIAQAQVHATLAAAPELTDATEEVNNVLATWRGQGNRTRLSVELMDALDALRVAAEGK